MKKRKKAFTFEGDLDELFRPHGAGTGFYNGTEIYCGSYANGVRHGYGEYRYSNKEFYQGYWENGKRHGEGVYAYQDGSYYKGDWLNDMKDGMGTMTYVNADVYVGEWHKGVKHGDGLFFFYAQNCSVSSTWENGVRNVKNDFLVDDKTTSMFSDKITEVPVWKNSLIEENEDATQYEELDEEECNLEPQEECNELALREEEEECNVETSDTVAAHTVAACTFAADTIAAVATANRVFIEDEISKEGVIDEAEIFDDVGLDVEMDEGETDVEETLD